MADAPVWVVIRALNDVEIIEETLRGVRDQSLPCRILVLDNESDDGTAEIAQRYADQFVTVPRGDYRPGRVLNQAMRLTDGEFVVFLNSDCPPQNDAWLERLLSGFAEGTAAVFGRQIPRRDCYPIFVRDTENTFGDGRHQAAWRHCFSMASSAVRRESWLQDPFSERLTYSEDIDWTWRARQHGQRIAYVADSVVEHSHNYSVRQFYRRQYGEGKADAAIFDWDPWASSWLRYSILPCLRQILGDFKFCWKQGEYSWLFWAPCYRVAQALGRRRGFVEGQRERI